MRMIAEAGCSVLLIPLEFLGVRKSQRALLSFRQKHCAVRYLKGAKRRESENSVDLGLVFTSDLVCRKLNLGSDHSVFASKKQDNISM